MKDIKYIIKRVIIGLLIAIILTFINNFKAHALIQSQSLTLEQFRIQHNQSGASLNFVDPKFQNFGQGNITFTFNFGPTADNGSNRSLRAIWLTANNGSIYVCEIGTLQTYWDTSKQNFIVSSVCPVDTTNTYIKSINVTIDHQTTIGQGMLINFSQYWTFSSNEVGSYDRIINAISASTTTQANYIEVNAQKIVDAIQNNNTQIIQQQQQIVNNTNNINNSINSSDTAEADSEADSFINSINTTDTTGLSSIITAPLRMITNLTNQCQPISLTIPYINKQLALPCMSSSVYPKFSGLPTTIAIVINGFLIYRVIASLYYMVKGFKDPENDKVEVMDL